jgi:deoxyuridine 5'-triphosphate nucleotidohydrolase
MEINSYLLGFLSYINENHTKYSKYCYELSDICEDNDKLLLDKLKYLVDIIEDDNGITSMELLDTENNLKKIEEQISKLNEFTDKEKREYMRGIYEFNYLKYKSCDNDIKIKKSGMMKNNYQELMDYLNIPYIITSDEDNNEYILIKYGCNTLDFLGLLYYGIDNTLSFNETNYNYTLPRCCVIRVDENAIMPTKAHWSDVGFDLSIIKKIKDLNSRTILYDTGLKIQLDFGYYAEIVPRSSISKTGYILANNIGIIDNSYRGNLMIALTKIADDAIEIEYPFKCCQLIIRKQVLVGMEEVGKLENTMRQEGGFGSSDK